MDDWLAHYSKHAYWDILGFISFISRMILLSATYWRWNSWSYPILSRTLIAIYSSSHLCQIQMKGPSGKFFPTIKHQASIANFEVRIGTVLCKTWLKTLCVGAISKDPPPSS
jgi:hypothetical protein